MGESAETLPYTRLEKMDENKSKWSYLYAYNIRTVRDIFAYCASHGGTTERDLFKAMEDFKIPPPKDKWVNPNNYPKQIARLRWEYFHAAVYLDFLKREGGFLVPNFLPFKDEKETIIRENTGRTFEPSKESPQFTEAEKEAMLRIVMNYERGRDFLRWFLDFSRFPNNRSFDEEQFRKNARPIYFPLEIGRGKKGKESLKREVDGKVWKIPDEKHDDYEPHKKPRDDYTRLASYILPSWFKQLGLIDEVVVFPEFSADKQLWYMYYPINMAEVDFMKSDIAELIDQAFVKEEGSHVVWIPYLIYKLAKKFYCPVASIRNSLVGLYRRGSTRFFFERSSLQVMKYSSKLRSSYYEAYRNSFIKIDGFYRSYLNIAR